MDYYHNSNKICSDEYKNNIDNIGYAGVWPSNYNDLKVLPIGTPGVALTDIYNRVVSKNGNQNDCKTIPIGDHSYPVPVPVPVITPRTRQVTRELLREDIKHKNQSKKASSVDIKPKRRSMESINIKNRTQGAISRKIADNGNNSTTQSTKRAGGYGFPTSNDQRIKGQRSSSLNRTRLGSKIAENGDVSSSSAKSVNNTTLFSSGTRLRRPTDIKNSDLYVNHNNGTNNNINNYSSTVIKNKGGSFDLSQRDNFESDSNIHQVPEDYCSNLGFNHNISCYQNNSSDEFPAIPYPFSMNEDNGGYLECNYEPTRRNQFDNIKNNYNYGSQEHINRRHDRHNQHSDYHEKERQQRIPIRRTTQSEKPMNSSGIRNFYSGRSSVPINTNLNRPKDYSRYVDNYYNTEEIYRNNNYYNYYDRNIKGGSGSNIHRPTLTNQGVGLMNPLNNCIPKYESPNQLNPPTYNCYSVPKRYNHSIQDLYREEDTYSDLGSCVTPTKTLMYCSGQYPNLEADRHIRENYSTANEVFKPKMYETIIYPPGYFEYKKQLDDLKKKYMLERDPNAFYSMKSKGEFLSPENNINASFCMCSDNHGKCKERRKTNPIFVRTTNTVNHYRSRPNPACYC
ncbi:hypothetical protein FG379_003204 [Cryptosporidium bovis]|uniref:uncharacterized protein n=1 Tax=Cryptosporidium bovis TaxID=310047 RepID=UPI003519F1A1|nr:hypothetical protein FG379_003204 [Cryptosporidium bovis]